ncbi:LD-carboxypeptidase [bacterium]|nr:LD-carboxypeptidase [bacterium]
MNFPGILEKRDTIGITATSSGLTRETDVIKLENAIKNLNDIGYKVIETDNVRKSEKLVSSSGEKRAEEFYSLYTNHDVKYIIAASGGEFLMEMLPYLNKYQLEGKNPKWVQGFSDTSLLLYYLTTKYNIATIHGSNLGGYGRKEIHSSYIRSIEIISSEAESVQESYEMYEAIPRHWQEGQEFELPNLDTKVEYKNLYGEKKVQFAGRLIGGCMDVLKTLIGTPYDYTQKFCNQFDEGMIWYLENCEMSVTDMYRALWQMREAGWFKNANGVLIGRTRSKETVHDFSYEDALHATFDGLEIPVIYDIDVGHVDLQWTMINGSLAEFEYEEGKGIIRQRFE